MFLPLCRLSVDAAEAGNGYFRFPAIHGENLVFTAEGDLWRASVQGGVAQRLTSHPGHEGHATFSPDGTTLAFTAEYEGPTELYTMPSHGGLPTRRTFGGVLVESVGWTPGGQLMFSDGRYWALPGPQLSVMNLANGHVEVLPLSPATRGVFDASGEVLFFSRLPFNRGSVKRYKGGTAENLWRYKRGDDEAKPLTSDFLGTSRAPMWWNGRVYFLTDRDGTMNLWSMRGEGGDFQQHTRHSGWDAKWPSLHDGRMAYQLGADLRLYDIRTDKDAVIPIALASDFEHQREKWVKKPMEYVTSERLSPAGDKLALTARGQIFVAPVSSGRLVEVTRNAAVRYRAATFMPDGKSILALSDERGEAEFVRISANGLGTSEILTTNGQVLRYEGVPSPDSRWVAWSDKDQKLWVLDVERRTTRFIADAPHGNFGNLNWSPDSRWLAYVAAAENQYLQIWLWDTKDSAKYSVTSDRVYSYDPAWSPDGKWLYFISDRNLQSIVSGPWGARQPEPYFDRLGKLYAVALRTGLRSPFEAPDELHSQAEKAEKADKKSDSAEKSQTLPAEGLTKAGSPESTNKVPEVRIEMADIQNRVWELPVAPGNYSNLEMNDKRLFWISRDTGVDAKQHLHFIEIGHEDPKSKILAEDIRSYQLSANGKKLLVRKGDIYHIEEASAGAQAKLEKSVDLKSWTFALNPRDEWRQMFVEAWRLERDYFYDRRMHSVDWPAILRKYMPLVDRVTDRAELSDLIGEMVGELSALHIRVSGGDHRGGPDDIKTAGLGARLVRDELRGGWRIARIYRTDPDYPDKLSPLARPGVEVSDGDLIESINGISTLSVAHPQALLRNQAGRQVLLKLKKAAGGMVREVVVRPISTSQEASLLYSEWEYTRRLKVEEVGNGELGYVHLRAMGADDIAQWAREYYPIHRRKGLIVDVRHNSGGNIDSWILEKLLRKAWFFWQPRVGSPTWNMHYAFRGHMVVLCDEFTGSDGEAFAEGFRRLGMGKVIGKRTWGGEIWLSASNLLVDRGIATAAEIGVYGPEGQWLIEGHGVEPDIEVENLPHATFKGEDAQLLRAIRHLQDEIRTKPIVVPPAPAYPNKSERP